MLRLLFFISTLFAASSVFGQDDTVRFTILHTNDEHSILMPIPMVDYHPEYENPTYGGFARLATKVKEIRELKSSENEPVLLFSGGDIFGGSPFAWLILNDEAPEIKLMQHIGYDAMVVGNHEFDYGPDVFASYLNLAGYPGSHDKMKVISSNIEIPDSHALNDAEIKRTSIFELENGLKVGVFGLLGKDAVSVAPLAEPVTFSEQHETARKYVHQLREDGADVVIAITHSGVAEDRALAEDVDGIDVIVGGHTHTALYNPVEVNNTLIVQAGYYLRYLGKLELEYNATNGQLTVLNERNQNPFLIPLDSSVPEDPETAEIIAEYGERLNNFLMEFTDGTIEAFDQRVAFSEQELRHAPRYRETAVGNFVTDAMRIVSEEVTGERVDFAFQGNGVIRADVTPGTMEWSEKELLFIDLATIAGLGTGPDLTPGYPIVSVYLTGEEIYRVLEISALLSQFLGNTYFLQVSGLRFETEPERSILFRIPFSGTPIPTYRAVFGAELFLGDGKQHADGPFRKLEKDDQLYHVISDYYVTSFMPMIGELLPNLELILKDKDGNPLDSIDDAVVHKNGRELKVWETITQYAASFGDENTNSFLPESYTQTGKRIIIKKGFPLIVWPVLGLILVIGLVVMFVRWLRNRRRTA